MAEYDLLTKDEHALFTVDARGQPLNAVNTLKFKFVDPVEMRRCS